MHSESIAWLNGNMLPLRDAALSVLDAGVTSGASVTERLRTFRHQPFLLDEHLERLRNSAEAAFVRLSKSDEELRSIVSDIVARNASLLLAVEDLAISVFATDGDQEGPTLCVHASRIPAKQYADSYQAGLAMTTPPTRAMPGEVLSPHIKTRNRLHWHIADRQANEMERGTKALLLDGENFITETSTGNPFIVRNGTLLTPRRTRTLCGISQAFVMGLAAELGRSVSEEDLRIEDVLTADEAFVTSSVYCVLPVVRLNRCDIADGLPGHVFRELLAAWSQQVGVNISEQMRQMAEAPATT